MEGYDFARLVELEAELRKLFPSLTCVLDHDSRMPEFIRKALNRAHADARFALALDAQPGLPTDPALREQRQDEQHRTMLCWVKAGVIVGILALLASIMPLVTRPSRPPAPTTQTRPAEP